MNAHVADGWDMPSHLLLFAGILSIALRVKTCLCISRLHSQCDLGQVTHLSKSDEDHCSYPAALLGGVTDPGREKAGHRVRAPPRGAVLFYRLLAGFPEAGGERPSPVVRKDAPAAAHPRCHQESKACWNPGNMGLILNKLLLVSHMQKVPHKIIFLFTS